MALRFEGLHVRIVRPDHFRTILERPGLEPGQHFSRFFAERDFDRARQEAHRAGILNERGAGALIDCVLQAGEVGGFLSAGTLNAVDFERSFVAVAHHLLGDERLAIHLLKGGFLDHRGQGHHVLGSIPLTLLRQVYSTHRPMVPKEFIQAPITTHLTALLESSIVRTDKTPDAHLVLVMSWIDEALFSSTDEREVVTDPGSEIPIEGELDNLMAEAWEARASDVLLLPEQSPVMIGAFGRRPLRDFDLRWQDTRAIALALSATTTARDPGSPKIDRPTIGIFGHDVPGIGRLRATITRERGAYAIGLRLLGPRLPTLENLGVTPDQIAKLKNLTPGLWIIGGRTGSGRSTTLAALAHQLAHDGRHVATFEDPIGFSFSRTTGIRQLEFETDLNRADCKRIVRSLAVEAILIDLVDDDLAIDLALDAAAHGRLAICAVRSLSTAALVQRAVSMDAALQHHRIAEHLSGIVFQQLAINETKTAYKLQAEIFIPDEALRRHLRSSERMPPASLFEPAPVSSDEKPSS